MYHQHSCYSSVTWSIHRIGRSRETERCVYVYHIIDYSIDDSRCVSSALGRIPASEKRPQYRVTPYTYAFLLELLN